MKLKLYIVKISLIVVFLNLVSCKDFGDINVDPIHPTKIDPIKQLVNTQMRYGGDYNIQLRAGAGIIYPLLQQFGGYFTGNSGARYAYSESIFSRTWQQEYTNSIPNLVDAVQTSAANPNKPNVYAMVRIMKVLVFLRLTDLYGDIPYSQAGRGFSDLIARPKYDRQEEIYNDFFKELKESHDLLNASADAVPQEQFYRGDITKWKKLANSLRLRIAMRLIKVSPTRARQEAEAAIADGVMTSNDDICYIKYENVQSTATEVRGNALSSALMAVSDPPRFYTTFLNMLVPEPATGPADPRLDGYTRCYLPLAPLVVGTRLYERVDITPQIMAHYATPANPMAGVNGIAPGSATFVNSPARSNISINIPGVGTRTIAQKDQRRQMANYLFYMDAPYLIVTYSEVALLLAEAKVRGWNAGTPSALDYYRNGIRASIEQLRLFRDAPTFAGVSEFVNSKSLTSGQELAQINKELYLSLFLNAPENFANWRRSGYPLLLPVGETGVPIPRRLQYPLNEIEQNSENLTEATQHIQGVAGNGRDSFLNRVWWDIE